MRWFNYFLNIIITKWHAKNTAAIQIYIYLYSILYNIHITHIILLLYTGHIILFILNHFAVVETRKYRMCLSYRTWKNQKSNFSWCTFTAVQLRTCVYWVVHIAKNAGANNKIMFSTRIVAYNMLSSYLFTRNLEDVHLRAYMYNIYYYKL